MEINDRLYVEIIPYEGSRAPPPHPVTEARFDPALVYKVLGMVRPSEGGECYFILANQSREIWSIPQRHLRAYGLITSDKLFLAKPSVRAQPAATGHREDRVHNASACRSGLMGRLHA